MGSGTHDVTVTLAARFINLAMGVLTQSVLAWCLGPGDRGSYAACMVFGTVLSTIFLFGLDMAGHYHTASKKMTPAEGVSTSLALATGGALMAILAGMAVMHCRLPFLESFFEKSTALSFLLAMAMIVPMTLNVCISQLLVAFKSFLHVAILTFVMSILQLLAILAMVWLFNWGVNGAMAASLVAATGAMVLGLVYLWRQDQVRWNWPRREASGHMLRYGLRYYVGSLSNMTDLQIGAVLLAAMTNRENLGFFSVAMILVGRANIIPDTVAVALMPRLAEKTDGRPELTAQCGRILAVLTVVLMGLLAIFASPIVNLLFSPKFSQMVALIRIMAIGSVIRCSAKAVIPYLVGTNRPGAYSTTIVIGTLVNLGLLLILLPVIGLPGAAWAMTIGHAVAGLVLIGMFHYYSRMSVAAAWLPRIEDWKLVWGACGKVAAKLAGSLPFRRRRT